MLEINAIDASSANTSCALDLESPVKTDHKAKISRAPTNAFPSTWTYEQFCRLRTYWAEGKSGTQSAAAINEEFGTNYSRSAIIGKANREGLPPHPKNPGGRPKGCHGNRGPRPSAVVVPDIADQLIPFAQRKTLVQLENGDCKWPVGNPDEPTFFFCGGKSLETAPYCAGHAKRAYGYTREKTGVTDFRF